MNKKEINKRGLTVKVINNNVSKALSMLKKLVNEEGIKKELRLREHYVSKGEKKRKALAAAKRRQQKAVQDFRKQDLGLS